MDIIFIKDTKLCQFEPLFDEKPLTSIIFRVKSQGFLGLVDNNIAALMIFAFEMT